MKDKTTIKYPDINNKGSATMSAVKQMMALPGRKYLTQDIILAIINL